MDRKTRDAFGRSRCEAACEPNGACQLPACILEETPQPRPDALLTRWEAVGAIAAVCLATIGAAVTLWGLGMIAALGLGQ